MSEHTVTHDGVDYVISFGAVRQSLTEDLPMLWGFTADIDGPDGHLGRKTCFVSRVSVQVRDEKALAGGMDTLAPTLYAMVLEKITEHIAAGETESGTLFAEAPLRPAHTRLSVTRAFGPAT